MVLAHKLVPQRTFDDSELDADEILGAAADPIKCNRKQAKTRSRRYVTWIQRVMALPELLCYLAITQDAMQVHYDLFKHGALDVQDGCDERPGHLFDFCWDDKNRACKIIELLREMLILPRHDNWFLLNSLLGGQEIWTDSFIMKCRHCLLSLMGGFHRRMVRRWKQWPWLLCHVVDPRRSMEHRQSWAQALWDASPCCLDSFSLKLRDRLSGPEGLFEPAVQRFIRQMLNQSVYTTSLCESMFGCFRQWAARSRKPLRCSLLSAKHVMHRLQQMYKQSMGNDKHRRRRPVWTAKAPRKNGRHLFIGKFTRAEAIRKKRLRYDLLSVLETQIGFKDAGIAWGDLAPAEKRQFGREARQNNRSAKVRARTDLELYGSINSDCGPWGLGDDLWPYSVRRLEADGYNSVKDFVPLKCKEWCRAGKRVFAKRSFDEGRKKKEPPCFKSWSVCPKSLNLTSDEKATMDIHLEVLRCYTRSKAPEQALLGIIDKDYGARYFVQCISHNAKPFEGEFLWYNLVSDDMDAADECPYEITINDWTVMNEKDVVTYIYSSIANLTFLKLTYTRASTMANLLVTQQIVFDPEEERKKAEELKMQRMQ